MFTTDSLTFSRKLYGSFLSATGWFNVAHRSDFKKRGERGGGDLAASLPITPYPFDQELLI